MLSSAFQSCNELWIRREGGVSDVFQRGIFDLGREAVALFECGDFKRVDGVDEELKFIGERALGFEIHAGGEHGVDGEIEVEARGIKTAGAIVLHAGDVAGLGACDELGGLRAGGLCGLCGRGLGGRGGICGRARGRLCSGLRG